MPRLFEDLYYGAGSYEGYDEKVRKGKAYLEAKEEYQAYRDSLEQELPSEMIPQFERCLYLCELVRGETQTAAFRAGALFAVRLALELFRPE